MTFKTIAAFIDPSPEGEARADAAAALSLRFGAHLVGIYVLPIRLAEEPAEAYARGEAALRDVIARRQAVEAAAAAAMGRRFAEIAGRHDISAEFRIVQQDRLEDETLLNSLHSDLVIVGHPRLDGLPENRSPDGLLLATGVPILVLPADRPPADGGTVLVAWNASRQARRAITDALPFLRSAAAVVLLVVDAEKNSRHGAQAGADIGLFLARHGVKVEVQQRQSGEASVADTILAYAKDRAVELIVLGAYSHPRAAEVMFGGVTRSLLKASPIPLLIAH